MKITADINENYTNQFIEDIAQSLLAGIPVLNVKEIKADLNRQINAGSQIAACLGPGYSISTTHMNPGLTKEGLSAVIIETDKISLEQYRKIREILIGRGAKNIHLVK